MSPTIRLPWQRPLSSNGALNILQLWASGGRMREPISMKFGIQQHVRAAMTVTWPNIKIFKIQSGGRPPCWKILAYHNSLSNVPIGTKLGWSHPITLPTCPPKWGCHGNGRCLATDGRCLATALWTFSSYGRLHAERVNQFWWNFVYNSKFGQQWQSCDKILKVGGRSLLENIRNAITRQQMDRLGRNLGGRIPSCSQYWKYCNSSYDGTDWDDSWVVASKQHLCYKTVFLVFGRYC